MQLPFGQCPLQSEEEPTVGRGGIIQAIHIGNQAALVAPEIQQWIPVRAVARETRDVIGEDDAHLPERHLTHQRVEALSVLGTRRAVAEIGVDDLNGLWGPAQRLGVLGEGILEPEAFLMAQGLVRGRLAEGVAELLICYPLWVSKRDRITSIRARHDDDTSAIPTANGYAGWA